MPEPVNPIRETDDDARALAVSLVRSARTAALAVLDPTSGAPFVSRIGVAVLPGGRITTLISALSLHTRALRADPRCCLLFGETGEKGDPLNHPRLSLSATAHFVERDTPEDLAMRTDWVVQNPKAKLYVDFSDFAFAVFSPLTGSLNGGFARAYALGPDDLRLS